MTYTKTSQTSPINLAYLPSGFPGKVSLTIAPGKHQASKQGFLWARDLAIDLDRLVDEFETQVLVCLLEDHELSRLKIPGLVQEAEKRGLQVVRLPIPDGGTLPHSGPVEEVVRIIIDHAQAGRNVVIHCAGGLGRSGTIGGCFLVDSGMDAEEALKALVTARGKRCPENDGQKDFIRDYAKSRRGPGGAAGPGSKKTRASSKLRGADGSTAASLRPLDSMISGAVLGAAIGDAMGNPTEFMSMEDIHAKFGPDGVHGFEEFIEHEGNKVAPYTDDTQMAEAVIRGLLEGRQGGEGLDRSMEAIAQRFIRWSTHPQGGHRAPGNACLAGCRALGQGVHWSKAGGETAGGCGSVMRAYPFGIFFRDDLKKAEAWAVAHSALTHRDPIALAACAAMAVGMARILRGEDVNTVVSEMVAAACRYSPRTAGMMTRAISEAQDGTDPKVTLDRLRGWAAHEAIAAAVFVFVRHPDDPRAAILEAINSPGDSDSLGTLAGAMVGARCGLGALPSEWVEQVERADELAKLAGEMRGRGSKAV